MENGDKWENAIEAALAFADQGGFVLYILAAMSVIGLAIIIYKIAQFLLLRAGAAREDRAIALWLVGDDEAALRLVSGRKTPTAAMIASAIELHADSSLDRAGREELLQIAAAARLSDARIFMRSLELIVITAPLLGLLGTVLGMIEAFRSLETAGGRVDPSILSGGIWVALLTTAAGLLVAIPAAACLSFFEGAIEKTTQRMETAVTRILMRPASAVRKTP